MGRLRSDPHRLQPPAACLSRTASSPSPSSDTNLSVAPWQSTTALPPILGAVPNLELQLLTKSAADGGGTDVSAASTKLDEDHSTQLQLSIGSSEINGDNNSVNANVNGVNRWSPRGSSTTADAPAARVKEQAEEQLRIAMAEKAYAEEARRLAKKQIELAEQEFANAKRIRQQAAAELEKARALKDHATSKINSAMLEITCRSCKHRFRQAAAAESPPSLENSNSNSNSVGLNFISAALRDWEVKKGEQK